jgi:hypothetical protein
MNNSAPNYGTASAIFGLIALVSVLIVGLSLSGDDGVSGPIVKLVSVLIGEPSSIAEPEFKKANVIEVNESGLRMLLGILAVCASIASGILAILAAKNESNSLWYALGVFASIAALTELNYVLAGVFGIIIGVSIMWRRQWKMTTA